MKILFVCTANICRSPMCEAYFNYLATQAGVLDKLSAESAGVAAYDGESASSGSRLAVSAFDTQINFHRSRLLTRSIIDSADLVVAMTKQHKEYIIRMFPDSANKVVLLHEDGRDVNDPYGWDATGYQRSFSGVKAELEALFQKWNKQS